MGKVGRHKLLQVSSVTVSLQDLPQYSVLLMFPLNSSHVCIYLAQYICVFNLVVTESFT